MPIRTPALSKQLLAKMHLEIRLYEVRTASGRDLGKTEQDIGREPQDKKVTKNFWNNCLGAAKIVFFTVESFTSILGPCFICQDSNGWQ